MTTRYVALSQRTTRPNTKKKKNSIARGLTTTTKQKYTILIRSTWGMLDSGGGRTQQRREKGPKASYTKDPRGHSHETTAGQKTEKKAARIESDHDHRWIGYLYTRLQDGLKRRERGYLYKK